MKRHDATNDLLQRSLKFSIGFPPEKYFQLSGMTKSIIDSTSSTGRSARPILSRSRRGRKSGSRAGSRARESIGQNVLFPWLIAYIKVELGEVSRYADEVIQFVDI